MCRRGRHDRNGLCTTRCVVIEKLGDETYVDEDKVGGENGLEWQLIGKKTANEIRRVA